MQKFQGAAPPRGWNMVFWKSRFCGYNCTSKSLELVDQSSPNLELLSITLVSDFGYLNSFRRYSRIKWEWVQNQAKFGMFLALKIFLGPVPKFLGQCYKTEHASEHNFVAIVTSRGTTLKKKRCETHGLSD